MGRTVAIGIQNYNDIIENNYFYIDKTTFIKEWWESGDTITLITRPRRFGKTLTMNMLEQFFSLKYAGRSDLFEKQSIWQEESYRDLHGTYPVISLSFANVKGNSFSQTYAKICQFISDLYGTHHYLLDCSFMTDEDKRFFHLVSLTCRQ